MPGIKKILNFANLTLYNMFYKKSFKKLNLQVLIMKISLPKNLFFGQASNFSDCVFLFHK